MIRLLGWMAIWLAAAPALFGQGLNPVVWSARVDGPARPGSEVVLRLTAAIEPGWHLYSFTTPGAIPTSVKIDSDLVETFRVYQPQPVRKYDPNFEAETETYDGEAAFLVAAQLKRGIPDGPTQINLEVRNQACDDTRCLPPRRHQVPAALVIDPGASASAFTAPAGYELVTPGAARRDTAAGAPPEAGSGPAARDADSAAPSYSGTPAQEGLIAFLAVAFGFGLAAVFTPCVFPMIPITMSYFLNAGSGGRAGGVKHAAIFSLGIIVLFSALGLATTAILGPFGVVQLGSNPWVNLFIAAVFFAFGLSLLGAFEITVPAAVLNKLNAASGGGGVLGSLLMGLTFSLAAFACVGPFVGTLLAASVEGAGMRPFIGMSAFACGLAAPFFLLALFPSYLQKLPRSGGWLARVKVVMGFVILGAMFKYLSTPDQIWGLDLLTRERFLAVWIVLAALAGLYLLGFLRLPGVKGDEPLSLGRLFAGAAFLIFAISLGPGIYGGNLGELEPYVPAPQGSYFAASGGAAAKHEWRKDQYQEALAGARDEGKLLFVNFTGYACTNCKWMKANMFTRPAVASALENFVLVELYTDGERADEFQQLQQSRFETIAIPFYAILRPDESVVATFVGLTRDEGEFLRFLQTGQSQVSRSIPSEPQTRDSQLGAMSRTY